MDTLHTLDGAQELKLLEPFVALLWKNLPDFGVLELIAAPGLRAGNWKSILIELCLYVSLEAVLTVPM